MKQPKPLFSNFRRNLIFFAVFMVILIIFSLSRGLGNRNHQTSSNPSPISGIPTQTPQNNTFRIITYSPFVQRPSIAQTNTSINLTFNRPLTQTEIKSLNITFLPVIQYQIVINKDYRNIYIVPAEKWTSGITYQFIIKSPHLTNPLNYSFTPTTDVDPSDVIGGEEKQNR